MIQAPTLTAGETKEYYDLGDFFRLMKSTDPITVRFYYQGRETFVAEGVERGYAERFRSGQFDRFTVHSDTAQTISFASRLGNEVSYDVPPTGAVTVSGAVALDATTLAALEVTGLDAATLAALEVTGLDAATIAALRPASREVSSGSWNSTAAMGANIPLTIIDPAANVAGALILGAGFRQYAAATWASIVFIAKNSPPATIADGEIILMDDSMGGNLVTFASLKFPTVLAAGMGLYAISQDALSGSSPTQSNQRYCRFKLL